MTRFQMQERDDMKSGKGRKRKINSLSQVFQWVGGRYYLASNLIFL